MNALRQKILAVSSYAKMCIRVCVCVCMWGGGGGGGGEVAPPCTPFYTTSVIQV